MQAIVYTRYGGPEVTEITELPVPLPATGEVQIRVAAAGLNPIDWHQRQGELRMVHPQTLPVIGGNELSGTISALGSDVSDWKEGDRVVVRCVKTKWSALAELDGKPSLDALEVKDGDRLLITGGAGGVGQLAIQLAKSRGAHVTTTASPDGKAVVVAAGADEVINYREKKLSDFREQFDKVFDTVGGIDELANQVILSVRKGGSIVSVGGPQTPGCLDSVLSWWKRPIVNAVLRYRASGVLSSASANGVKYQYIFMFPDGTQLAGLCGMVDAGTLKLAIDSRFPMKDFADAFKRLETGRAKGKVIVEF